MSLYLDHLATLQRQAESALARTGHDALVIASGIEKYAFLDDRPYLFQANPHFKHWLPLTQHPHSWLLVRPGDPPEIRSDNGSGYISQEFRLVLKENGLGLIVKIVPVHFSWKPMDALIGMRSGP